MEEQIEKARKALRDQLQAPFKDDEIEWRVSHTIKKDTPDERSAFVPYITNRAIQNRLDEVFGVSGWENVIKEVFENGKLIGFLCGISVRFYDNTVNGTYNVIKWDGSGVSNIEPIKGGISDSMKRAAVQFGIGRYLYEYDAVWCKTENNGKKNLEPQRLKLSTVKQSSSIVTDDIASDTDECIKKILSAKTMDELQQLWKFITKSTRNEEDTVRLVKAKDRRKIELGETHE